MYTLFAQFRAIEHYTIKYIYKFATLDWFQRVTRIADFVMLFQRSAKSDHSLNHIILFLYFA